MSATSGIGVSPDLSDVWAAAVESKNVRFIKVVINNGACRFLYPKLPAFTHAHRDLQNYWSMTFL
jgi:hypothetical protein